MAFRNPSLSNYYSTFQKKKKLTMTVFLWQISTPILYRMDLYMILSDQMIFVQRRKCVPFSIYTVFFLYEKVKKIVLVAKRPSSV